MAKNKKFICTGGEGGEIRVWEIKSHEMVSNLKEHKSKVTKIHLLSNDVHLITSAKDRSILIWDLPKEQRIATYTMAVGGVNSFKVNPLDENMMISVGQDRKITQWDIRQPKPVRSISSNPYNRPDEADELLTVDISNDGRYFATGGASGIIRSYDLPSMNFLTEVAAHSGNCTNVAFSKNDRYLITCGSDSQILTYTINYS